MGVKFVGSGMRLEVKVKSQLYGLSLIFQAGTLRPGEGTDKTGHG